MFVCEHDNSKTIRATGMKIADLFCNRRVNFVITTSQQTCFASELVDYALLLCSKFAAKLPHQFGHDKLISRKIKLAASVHAIWEDILKFNQNCSDYHCSENNVHEVLYACIYVCVKSFKRGLVLGNMIGEDEQTFSDRRVMRAIAIGTIPIRNLYAPKILSESPLPRL
ncbi:hypothetical protein AVEN_21061-1 [Araneus ventricosus]|uniref:Uncharacterized protein n=1 Tax=Araneus ventricosus TaxID=182803 RepID=A0A4Y2SDL8_ARAVE|nr:hypothetical protein AVEN_190509-1 [Araneus ventricosus]GBN86318.1 hypothetical protein AVEN_151184-1 [Araneus ventricosus]GBN91821.1 hypothetical protein AVEN_193944-1 [Araneus ventricosus]GBN91824.1 hypothetical protein AVEN_21061-1 [Araneus ventricosus]